MLLSKTVALVTGGGSGLGAATVSQLIKHGARVLVADLPAQEQAFEQMQQALCPEEHSSCPKAIPLKFCATDVTSQDELEIALNTAEIDFGEPINLAVSCAGVATARKTLSQKGPHPLDDFVKTLTVNTIGTFNLASLAAARMSRREPDEDGLRGCIINVASIAAYEGQIGQVAYAASKGAIVGMTLPMARDLAAYGIRVMTLAPGLFETPLLAGLPQQVKEELAKTVPCPSRLGRPDEFGELVVSVVNNHMLNGTVIRLDGALRMSPI